MKTSIALRRSALPCALMGFVSAGALAQDNVTIQGAVCATPPPLHCPDSECSGAMVINQGPVVEMKTRRTYFLDYPCDLKPGEKVTFILSLHGGGSYGNWQRHYFPLLDYKDKYRLVIATPNSPVRVWSDADDQYLQNIVEFVVGQLGKENIKAFWLVGPFAGRLDVEPHPPHGLLQEQGRRLAQPVGRPARRQSRAAPRRFAAPRRQPRRSAARAAAALRREQHVRSRGGAAARAAGHRLLIYI